MKKEPKNGRSPTPDKLKPMSEASKEARKKIYRKRTMDEVKRSLERGSSFSDRLDGNGKDTDESTVDLATDTAYSSAEHLSEYAKSYSNKLRASRKDSPASKAEALKKKELRPGTESVESAPKRSEALRSERIKTETVKNETASVKTESKKFQKEKIKKNYAKTVREAEKKAKSTGKTAGKFGKKTTEDTISAVEVALQKIGEFVKEHPIGAIVAAIIIIALLVIVGTVSSCSMAFGGVSGGAISATYSAEDSDIYGAEADYCSKEAGLQTTINNIEYTNPGYDEYNYDLDVIGHNPWELASILTVIHADYTRDAVQGTLTSLFDAQYTLTLNRVVETRYRTEERTGYYAVPVYDAENELMGYELFEYTYEVEVPYSYYILNVTLENRGINDVVAGLGLDADSYELYEYLIETKGEKTYLW